MDLGLSHEQKLLVETVRNFVSRELLPLEDEVENSGCLSDENAWRILEKSRALGLYAMNIPQEFGGGGLSTLDWILAEEQFGHTTDILVRRAFGAKGAKHDSGDGKLKIKRHGAVRKLVDRVEQITFSGSQSVSQGQQVYYVTERAVFELTAGGVRLIEIAPGVDLKSEILDRMGFAPAVAEPLKIMDARHFQDNAA